MAPRRLRPVAHRVQLRVDGDLVEAEAGEPVAVALTAAGRLVLGRSVKYHRPRGAACYGGRCDGCLMRVAGVQSVMTCRVPASDGLVVDTQNVVGSAENDLLAATDWFFRGGMNHHEMFTWNEQVNRVMQKIARRIAGIGELPDGVLAPAPLVDHDAEVLVIGGGPAGLAAATRHASDGRSVLIVDEEPEPGGALRWWPGPVLIDGAAVDAAEYADRLVAAARQAGVEILSRTSAVAAYEPWEDAAGAGDPPVAPPDRRAEPPVVIADAATGALRIRPRRVVIACGRHEGAAGFEGADRAGVIGVRAACVLLAHGVLPGERVLLVGEHPAMAPLADALRSAGAAVLGPIPESDAHEALGRPSVKGCRVLRAGVEETWECDAIVVGPPSSAVYELASQLGVEVSWSGVGYELGAAPPDVEVVGWARAFGAPS